MTPRELHMVELVSPAGSPVGTSTVLEAHTAPGVLHRAFSVLLFDPAGRTLLQQRSASKTRFPLCWANSCCGHPAPGEPVTVAANRRLGDELGVRGVSLVDAGVYLYRAVDPSTGRVEHEYDHVLVGRVPAGLAIDPDPREVAAVRWVEPEILVDTLARHTRAPWLTGVLDLARGSAVSP
jgi:isopentenyl-diphosphate delta-isomerase